MQKVFDGQSANGSSTAFQSIGGKYKAIIAGTWDGATVKVETSADKSTYVSAGSDCEFTADGQHDFPTAPNEWIRLTLSSAGGSTDLDGWLNPAYK